MSKEEKQEFSDIQDVLSYIQRSIKAPKSQYNKFGNYYYRDAEDILEAVKKILPVGATIELEDEPVFVADRVYIKSSAILNFKKETKTRSAYSREPLVKKGMDEMQITGATSSYARKGALGGLLAIDDTKDSDKTSKEKPQTAENRDFSMSPATEEEKLEMEKTALDTAISMINAAQTVDALAQLWTANSKKWVKLPSYDEIEECKNFKKEELKKEGEMK